MSNSDFLKKVSGYIANHRLLKKDGKYLVGLSGGADSVALLCVLQALGYRIEAAHCNFHLRGAESLRDAGFCEKLCRDKGISLHKTDFDTRAYAAEHKVSIEMAARQLRYEYFESLSNQYLFDGVCVAHHRDDSVETLLINLIRGTGIHGLMGISPVQGRVLRPLLGIYRAEIEDFLRERNQSFVMDSSNRVDDVVRNKIRLNVLPLLQTINPSVSKCIAKTADHLREVANVVDKLMEGETDTSHFSVGGEIHLPVNKIKSELQLFYLLTQYGFSPGQVEQINDALHTTTGKMFHSDSHDLLFNRGEVIIRRRKGEDNRLLVIPRLGQYFYSEHEAFTFSEEDFTVGMSLDRGQSQALLDMGKVAFPLTVRRVEEGDRFVPLGMKGSKLLSDYMTDRKMTLFQKRAQLVVTDAAGSIVWLVNERPDQRFAVTANTRKILAIRYSCKQ